jgi:hypothetical protein
VQWFEGLLVPILIFEDLFRYDSVFSIYVILSRTSTYSGMGFDGGFGNDGGSLSHVFFV